MRKPDSRGRLSPSAVPMLGWVSVFVFLPLCYIVVISFLKRGEIYGLSGEFTLQNYARMANAMYLQVFLTSFVVAIGTTAACLFISYPFAYFTAKLQARTRSVILTFLMAPFWLNSLIRLNGWVLLLKSNGTVNSALQGLGLIDEPLKLLYQPGTVLLGMVYALCPFMILSIYNSVEKMDWRLVEAARDLGASPARAFLSVTFPLSLPGVISGCSLVFIPSVGLFFISDMLGGGKTMLLGNLIRNEMMTSRNWPFGAALSILMLILTLLFIRLYKRVSGGESLGGMHR